MAAKHEKSYILGASVNAICSVIRSAEFASSLRIEMKSENPTTDGVWYRFHHGTTFTSWGEKITITLIPKDSTYTSLTILSECGMPTQIIDWGKNKQNVSNIYDMLVKMLNKAAAGIQNTPAPASAPSSASVSEKASVPSSASAPEKASVPSATAEPVSTVNFCNNCGAKVIPGSLFCSNCGNKLPQ